jgi:hypothetical protein
MIKKQDELYYLNEKILSLLTPKTSELIAIIKRCILTRTSCTRLQQFLLVKYQPFALAFKIELIESEYSANGSDLIFSIELIQRKRRDQVVVMNEEIFDNLRSVALDATKRIIELLEAE